MGEAVNYVISGFPRMRSAWFCALLNAHGSDCVHDCITYERPCEGVSDPAAACCGMPFDGTKIYIHREDWLPAFESFLGIKIPKAGIEEWEAGVEEYARSAVRFEFKELDNVGVVQEILELCQVKPSKRLIETFQGLKIEQHLPKAQSAYAPSQLKSAV